MTTRIDGSVKVPVDGLWDRLSVQWRADLLTDLREQDFKVGGVAVGDFHYTDNFASLPPMVRGFVAARLIDKAKAANSAERMMGRQLTKRVQNEVGSVNR